jgi:predicted nucleotidyltransferase
MNSQIEGRPIIPKEKLMNSRLALNQKEERAVKEFVSAIKQKLKDHILRTTIFGSKVRGDYSLDSDIDILIVLNERSKDLIDSLYENLLDIELEYDSKISLTIFSRAEYQQNIEAHTPFMESLASEGVTL